LSDYALRNDNGVDIMLDDDLLSERETEVVEVSTIVSRTDLNGKIVFVNQNFIDVSGYSAEELIGAPHSIVRHPQMPKQVFADLWATIENGDPWQGLIKNRRKDGSHYWVMANLSPVIENGERAGYVSIGTQPTDDQIVQAEASYGRMRQATGANVRIVGGRLSAAGMWAAAETFVNSIMGRLCLALGLLICLMLLVGLVSLGGMRTSNEALRNVYEDRAAPIVQLAKISDQVRDLAFQIALMQTDLSVGQSASPRAERIRKSQKNVVEQVARLRAWMSSPQELDAGQKFVEAVKAFLRDMVDPALSAAERNEGNALAQLVTDRLPVVFKGVTVAQQQLFAREILGAGVSYESAAAGFKRLLLLVAGVVLGAVAVSVLLGRLLLRSVLHPVKRLESTFEEIARGNFLSDIPQERAKEFWHTVSMLRAMRVRLAYSIEENAEISQRAQELLRREVLTLAALQESEARFRRFFEKASSVMLLIDPSDGTIVDANEAAAAFYGHPLGRLVGMPINQVNTLPANEVADEQHAALCERQSHFIFKHRLASGEVRDVEVYSTPIEVARDGRPLLFSIVHDISERVRAEASQRESEEKLRNLYELSPLGIALTDWSGRCLEFNGAFQRICGYSDEELKALDYWTLTPRKYHADEARQLDSLLRTGQYGPYEKEYVRKDGSVVPLRLNGVLVTGRDGQKYIWSIVEDITERKKAEVDLRIAATAFESREGTMVTDADARILRVNRAFTDLTGYAASEVVGQNPRLLKSDRHDADFYRRLWETIGRTGGWQGEIWDRRKNGEVYPKWLTISAVKDGDGAVTHYVATHSDITERKKAEEKINELAFFDQLTGLPNRTLLIDRLKQAMNASTRSGSHGALLFIDLDNFKTLNDTLGHDMGDLLLKQVAQRLNACVRAGDTVARLGGDEFVLVLAGLSAHATEAATQAETVAEKILVAFNETYRLDEAPYQCTSSIGATLFNGHDSSIDDLLKQADLAMYKAKAAGRNAIRFFDPGMQEAVLRRAGLEADLREAVRQKQFLLHYQAQVAGQDRITGAEVLVRWQHPRRGLVSPAEFIPLAEETGLILPLGGWVLEAACSQLAQWRTRPETADLTVGVNVSARQIRQSDFVEQVLAILNRTGADPRKLKLELTESLLVENVQDIIEKMFALKARGVKFSLDDFGTGYSSLSYLKRLPLEQLKIDQSFVREILVDSNDAVIARTIVALGQSLGMRVIAEGVETDAQRAFLAKQGCEAFQGYFFSRPVPVEDFERLLMQPTLLPSVRRESLTAVTK
jgi:diguanylate cyclase (GGDEF)-like protein/PAS domain S-box-containing protein